MNNIEIIKKNEITVAIFPSEYADDVQKLLKLLNSPLWTPHNLVTIKFVRNDTYKNTIQNHLLPLVRDLRNVCFPLTVAPYAGFRASLKECKEFIKDEMRITIPRGFLPAIQDAGFDVEEV